ncbi:ribonuclease P protein component [candidate division WOR-3 bacterium]|jgi:ribonuclease P protein component|nr:ribonuclease P protein component [candidate division WOR-3 bacterium]
MAVDCRFPQILRLKKNKEFKFVIESGRKYYCNSVMIFIQKQIDTKIGIAVSSKRIRKATQRNRIKRLIREIIRCNKDLLPDKHHIVLFYNKSNVENYNILENDIRNLFKKI